MLTAARVTRPAQREGDPSAARKRRKCAHDVATISETVATATGSEAPSQVTYVVLPDDENTTPRVGVAATGLKPSRIVTHMSARMCGRTDDKSMVDLLLVRAVDVLMP